MTAGAPGPVAIRFCFCSNRKTMKDNQATQSDALMRDRVTVACKSDGLSVERQTPDPGAVLQRKGSSAALGFVAGFVEEGKSPKHG